MKGRKSDQGGVPIRPGGAMRDDLGTCRRRSSRRGEARGDAAARMVRNGQDGVDRRGSREASRDGPRARTSSASRVPEPTRSAIQPTHTPGHDPGPQQHGKGDAGGLEPDAEIGDQVGT